MDFTKLLNSIDDAVYEVMIWMMLIPKTIYRVIFQPNLAISYVNSEWEKRPEERFDEFLSPTLLWILIIVIPSTIFGGVTYIISTLVPEGPMAKQFAEMKFEDKLIINAFFALINPLAYLMVLEWANKESIKKTTLKRAFHLQCYAIVPGQLLIYISLLLVVITTNYEFFNMLAFLFFLFSFILAMGYETRFFHTELSKQNISWLKAVWYAVLSYGLATVLLVMVNAIVLIYIFSSASQ